MINLNDPEQKKEIRIFVSSTFRDMQGERDHLVKNVFPKLRKISRSRGAELTEVDLRWGVTEAQAEDGRVIEICLREIDRCRPFFIGLLGGRYGWGPESREYERHRRILVNFPWVKQDIDERLSITEMEIQYGVLRNPAMESRAFFYLRDPATISPENCEKPESAAANKLSSLRSLLTTQDDYPHHQYADLNELERLITDDFEKFIDTEYPASDTPSPLVRAQHDHAAFARSRLKLYIGGEDYFERIDEHVNGASPPLVIVGESGSGKSALLANWIAHHQRKHPDELVFYHFIGGAPDSSDHIDLMRRIMQEMRERFGLTDEVPTNPDQVAEALPLFLAQTPQTERWVLVLDALNQLEERGNARWLGWLPTFIPQNIRVVISTLPGESLEALEKRDYPQLAVQPMDIETRKRLIRSYLALYTKELSEDLADRIANGPACGSPLILRTLLDEIRIFGVHEKLQERIDYYLQPVTPGEFFDAVLRRLEEDYEHERPGMVGEVLSLVWAARRGLAERELLEITAIPPLFWAPLYHALENHLVSRSGLLDFFHDYLRQAVAGRYLPKPEVRQATHARIAEYFTQDDLGERTVDERPYHLQRAERWESLANYIGRIEILDRLSRGGRSYELLGYWNAIGDRYDMEVIYRNALGHLMDSLGGSDMDRDGWLEFAAALERVAVFLGDCGARYTGAIELYRSALEIRVREEGADSRRTSNTLGKLALLLTTCGRYTEAEPLFRRALEIDETILGAEHPSTAICLNNLAMMLCGRGDYAGAEPLYRRALEIDEIMKGDHPTTAASLNNLAALLADRKQYEEAEALYRRALQIRERLLGANHPDTAGTLNNLATLLHTQRDYAGAEQLFRRALSIFEQAVGDHPHTASALSNLGLVLHDRGDAASAEPLCRRALRICEQTMGLDNERSTGAMNTLALTLQAQGKLEEAEALLRRALAIDERVLGVEHPYTGETRANLERLLGAM